MSWVLSKSFFMSARESWVEIPKSFPPLTQTIRVLCSLDHVVSMLEPWCVLQSIIRPFREHHIDPTSITRHDCEAALWNIRKIFIIWSVFLDYSGVSDERITLIDWLIDWKNCAVSAVIETNGDNFAVLIPVLSYMAFNFFTLNEPDIVQNYSYYCYFFWLAVFVSVTNQVGGVVVIEAYLPCSVGWLVDFF